MGFFTRFGPALALPIGGIKFEISADKVDQVGDRGVVNVELKEFVCAIGKEGPDIGMMRVPQTTPVGCA